MASTVPPAPPLAIIEETFGPFVTGIMMQQLLMGVIVVQVYDYYRMFPKDQVWYKLLVAALFGVTVLQATMDFKILYRCAVQYYGNFDKFDDTDWSLWWEIAVTAIIGSIAQTFFLERCWLATKSWIVLGLGTAAILTSLASGIASTIEFQSIRRLSRVPEIPGPILTWLISTAIVDLGIAAVLVWQISRFKSRFRKTETMVGRIIRLTFQTSALTATIAVINVILYMGLPGQAYHLLPQLIMGKIYVISVMVTLSARSELREIYENTGGATYMETRHGATTAAGGVTVSSKVDIASVQRPMHTGTTSLAPPSTGIQISTTTYVRDDNDNYIDPIQFDSDSKHRDIELGPVSKGPGKDDVEIPIQYPDGHIEGKKGGDDSSDSEADYSVSKLGNRFGANRV